MNIESATLVLRTVNATNNITRTQSTWKVNMRQCLGNLYNKYSKFKICLTGWGQGVASTGFSTDDLSIVVSMTGLAWENQTYDTTLNGLTNKTVLSVLRFVNNGVSIENFTGEVGQVFIKDNYDEEELTISLEKVSGAVFPALVYPQCCYVFSIYGVQEEK